MFEGKVIYSPKAEPAIRYTIDEEDLEVYLDEAGLSREEVEVFPLSEATAEELSEVISSELENANYHGLTDAPQAMLEGMRTEGFSEEEQLKLLRILGGIFSRLV